MNKLRAITEREFQAQVIALATLKRWMVFHPAISQYSVAGFPDLVMVKPGRQVIFAELKSENGVVSAAQEDWLQVLREAENVDVYVWRPFDFDDIVHTLS